MAYKEQLIKNEGYNLLIDRLFEILSSQNITRYRIAKITGIDQTRLSKIFHRKVTLSLNEFIKISEAFSIEIELKKHASVKENTSQMISYLKKFIY